MRDVAITAVISTQDCAARRRDWRDSCKAAALRRMMHALRSTIADGLFCWLPLSRREAPAGQRGSLNIARGCPWVDSGEYCTSGHWSQIRQLSEREYFCACAFCMDLESSYPVAPAELLETIEWVRATGC